MRISLDSAATTSLLLAVAFAPSSTHSSQCLPNPGFYVEIKITGCTKVSELAVPEFLANANGVAILGFHPSDDDPGLAITGEIQNSIPNPWPQSHPEPHTWGTCGPPEENELLFYLPNVQSCESIEIGEVSGFYLGVPCGDMSMPELPWILGTPYTIAPYPE